VVLVEEENEGSFSDTEAWSRDSQDSEDDEDEVEGEERSWSEGEGGIGEFWRRNRIRRARRPCFTMC
jgi:hypothetical protein